MNKIVTVLMSMVLSSLLINSVKAQEKHPLPIPTKDNPIGLDASDGSRLTFYNYSIDNNTENQIIFLDGILSSPPDTDKNVFLTFNCNINDSGILTIGRLQQQTFEVESQREFPAGALQMFRYSYCDDVFIEKIIEERPPTDFATDDCNVVIRTDKRTELPCNYLAITVGDNAINYHYGLRDDEDNLYRFSYAVWKNSPNSIFAVFMNLQGEEPFHFEAQGQCQKQKINSNTEKLTCNAIAPDGSKVNGEVLVPSFNVRDIISNF